MLKNKIKCLSTVKKIIVLAIVMISALALIYFFTPILPEISHKITRITSFEVYSMPKRDDKIGISGKEVLLTKSSRLSKEQRNLIYSYIKNVKRIEDTGKPINSYLQASNDDFVIIKFSNNIALYLEPNSSICSNESTISDFRLSHDEGEFKRWFSMLRVELSEFVGISDSEVINMAMKYIQNPKKLNEKRDD